MAWSTIESTQACAAENATGGVPKTVEPEALVDDASGPTPAPAAMLAGAALLAFMGSVPVLPETAQAVFLAAIPASLVWLLRTTINHARSFEDLLRRIEHVEGALNRLAGDDLVGFQSSHPSRLKAVGGRTGAETVVAVLMAAFILIGACAVIGWETFPGQELTIGYAVFLGAIAAYLAWIIWRWTRYRYAARTTEGG